MSNIDFVGFEQYTKALHSPEFWNSISVTLYYTFAVVIFHVSIGLFLAVLLNKSIIGRTFFRSAYFIPVIMSTIVVGIIWKWLLSAEVGLINVFLGSFGIQPIAWLGDPKWAMPAIIIMSVWKWIGFQMVIYLAALQDIPEDLYEAADLAGASKWQKFRYITFPMLSATTWFLVITSIINSFQVFDQVYVMTGGGPVGATDVIVFNIYKHAFQFYDMGYASAVAWLLFVIIFIITMAQVRFSRPDWR